MVALALTRTDCALIGQKEESVNEIPAICYKIARKAAECVEITRSNVGRWFKSCKIDDYEAVMTPIVVVVYAGNNDSGGGIWW